MSPTIARLWKTGTQTEPGSPVLVSMNDYLIHRYRDVPRVAKEGLRFRRSWPHTEGALGLWFAFTPDGRRQISVSIWRSTEDLQRFVRTPEHLRVMRDYPERPRRRLARSLASSSTTTASDARAAVS